MSNLTHHEFLDYIRAFNDKDYEKQHAFYDESVQLIIPDPRIGALEGSEGIRAHYRPIHAAADETVIPIVVMIDRNKVFFSMETYFKYKIATDHAVHGFKVKPGDVIKITCWALYNVENKKMKKIVCNLFSDDFLGQVDVKACIRDSESRAEPDLRLYNY